MPLRNVRVAGYITAGLFTCTLLAQPKLDVVGGTTFSFGDLYSPSARKLLTLRNTGKDTLIVSNVGASCGCTGALISHDHIAPRDSGILQITFDAKRFNGPVEKVVSFATNDKHQEHVSVTFHANVFKTLELDPEYFYFSTYPDSVSTKEVTVRNSSNQTIRLLRIKASSDVVSVIATRDELEPGEETSLSASGKFEAAGTFSGNIEITTDHPKLPSVAIRYFALVKGKK